MVHMPERFTFDSVRDSLRQSAAARVAAATVALHGVACEDRPPVTSGGVHAPESATAGLGCSSEKKVEIDPNDPYLKEYPRGEFSKKERKERIKILGKGVKIFEDIGLEFYYVQPGDSIARIRAKLMQFPQYQFLADQQIKLQSFNIPNSELRAGMWIPIPLQNDERHVGDESFVADARWAIRVMKEDKTYGDVVKKILALPDMNEDKFVAAMLAIAKQESGGLPIGQFEFHRWEGHGSHHEFSFTMFHVLMTGPGLAARRALNMTEGQTYDTRNAVRLFVAFLAEKAKECNKDLTKYFPFSVTSLDDFATFYNGAGWKKHNKGYPASVLRYYEGALEVVE